MNDFAAMKVAFSDVLHHGWPVAAAVRPPCLIDSGGHADLTPAAVTNAIRSTGFEARPGDVLELVNNQKLPPRLFLIGAEVEATPQGAEVFAAQAVRAASARRLVKLSIVSGGQDPCDLALGALLAAYRFDRYRGLSLATGDKSPPPIQSVTIVCSDPVPARRRWESRRGVAEGMLMARDLINEPPNVLTPDTFALRLAELGSYGVEASSLGETELGALGMGALLGVGQGSRNETRLGVMVWRGAGDAPFTALVGKGVTFDTGGISLKPADKMEEMKCDMAGAAAILGTMHALAHRKARANVVGVVALVENMPDGQAQRPSDIVTSMSGRTIEIINTDGEGRLALADAVTWVQRTWKPSRIVDLATLTGAMIVSLGHVHAGLFSNDDALAEALVASGRATGETVWRMPLDPAYDALLDSSFADIKNSAGQHAGAITAAHFIGRFVEPGVAWAHLDIAGVATRPLGKDPRFPVWATGWGPRLLNDFISRACETPA